MFPATTQAILAVRRRADMENSQFIDDDEIIELMNDNVEIVYHACVAARGETFFSASCILGPLPNPGSDGRSAVFPNMTFQAGMPVPTRYDLPADFFSLIRCEWCPGTITESVNGAEKAFVSNAPNTTWYPMKSLDIVGKVLDTTPRDWIGDEPRYWITASAQHPAAAQDIGGSNGTSEMQIAFYPIPRSTVAVHILYVPDYPKFNTEHQIRMPSLAWKYVREATAADLLEKQRSDSGALRANAEKYMADLINTPLNPDNAEPPQTIDRASVHTKVTQAQRNIW